MRKHIRNHKFITLSIVLMLCILLFLFIDIRKRVLILHSYERDYTWVNQINQGIYKIFKDEMAKIIVKEHYMDLKNNQGEDFRKKAGEEANALIKEWKPDVIIISDDIGQKLVGSKYVNDNKISIVFCGVNGWVTKYGYDKANNITGIFERKPLKAIKETLLMVAETKKIPNKEAVVVFLCDTSDSVTAELPQFLEFNWKPLDFRTPIRVGNFIDWQKAVKDVQSYADIIVVSDYREFRNPDGTKEKIEPARIMAWTEQNSQISVIGMSLINVFDGGMVSVFNSGYEQGEVVGKMTMDIVNGAIAKDIPKVLNNSFLTSVRESAAGQKNFPLPEVYIVLSEESGKLYK